MKIVGIEEFGITINKLKTNFSDEMLDVEIHINYFSDLKILKSLSPKERRLFIRQKLRDDLKRILEVLPTKNFKINGTKIKPLSIRTKLTGNQILKIQNQKSIEYISIIKSGNLVKIKKKKEKSNLYFSVQGLFAIKVEGFDYTNSIRFTEERIILVKAKNREAAKKIAIKEFKKYSDFEYLNSDFKLTKWEFIDIIDIYETDVDIIDPKGTEIFSKCKLQKIKLST